ncbi:hypothetical protein ARMGADRAFT_961799 [Armillaria gallica]|uniref:Uncharacterized protein n=1 Tax=Armillaria gallica TaxID=47427 RepID=A0A2H3E9E0_ARMGA|nr:hypothetical protein ARMGADRAFT_961799 [Armillaria gallica]
MALTVDPSLFEDHPSISTIEKASRFLQVLRSSMKLEDAPSSFLSEKCIQKLLQENPMYYTNLIRCHAHRTFSELEDTPLLCPYPSKLIWEESCYLAAVQSCLEHLRDSSDALRDPAASSFWAPKKLKLKVGYDFKYADHIRSLEIPSLTNTDKPVLLLHDFGTFSSIPILNKRIARIYRSDKNSFFVNASASGKTRLLLEGLQQNWGLYFTAAVDFSTLGSRDIAMTLTSFEVSRAFNEILPPKEDPTFVTCLDMNTRLPYRQFSEVLLARLVVFRRFLETSSGRPDDQMRHRWLLAQLQPFLLQATKGSKRDPFLELRGIMQRWVVPDEFFDTAIRETLDSIFSLCPRTPGTPLFIVIDEGNVLANGGQYTFSHAFKDGRPILNELLTTWQHHLQAYEVTVIVAGTEIPQEDFQGEKWSKYQWCSDTGDFNTPELQRQYTSQFLPSSMTSSPSGEEFQSRMWKWFRRRHRFTAGVVFQLLTFGFQSPHRLLDCLISLQTGYDPHDGDCYSHAEDEVDFGRPYARLEMPDPRYYPSVKATIHDALIHCLVTLDHRLIFGIDRIDAVSQGIGRFVDPNMEHIVIDEPLCLVSCAQWFADKKKSLTDINFYLSVDRRYERPLSTTCFVALCLAHIFSKPRALADVFSFPSVQPEWANQSANLVDFSSADFGEKETGVLHYTPGTSRRLAYIAETQADTLTWLKDKHRTVFCIHSANSASPTLLFSLMLADESLIWLFLHVHIDGKTEELVANAELQDMLKALQPENLFNRRTNDEMCTPESPTADQGSPSLLETPSTAKSESSDPLKESEVSDNIRQLLETLPNRNQRAGACSVLRVVASLGADPKLDRLDVDADYPIAELNTRFVQSITEKFSAKDILEDVVANATYIGGHTGVKRKSIDDGPTLKRQRSASLFNNSVQEVDV